MSNEATKDGGIILVKGQGDTLFSYDQANKVLSIDGDAGITVVVTYHQGLVK
jgi:hypothetical protein